MQTPVGTPPRAAMVLDVGAGLDPRRFFRLLALAEELRLRACDVAVVCRRDLPAWAHTQVRARDLEVVPIDPVDGDTVTAVGRLRADAVVVDSCWTGAERLAALREVAPVSVVFSCGELPEPEADLLVDPEEDDRPPHRRRSPRGTTRLGGVEHWLLRNDVLANRPITPPEHGAREVARVVVPADGLCPCDATAFLGLLVATGRAFEATFLGNSSELRSAVASAQLEARQRATTRALDLRVHERLARADVVAGVATPDVYEWLCLGAPVALTWSHDDQVDRYRRLMVRRTVVGLGRLAELHTRPSTPVQRLSRLLADGRERSRLAEAGWSLVDGQGRARVADAILRLLDEAPLHPGR